MMSTKKVDFITGQTNDPDGIAIDPVNRNLYWINYDGGLGMKGLDGSGEKILIPDAEGARIIVVGNRIYFDYYNGSGDIHIKSANLDGSNLATLATGISRVVYGLAYDPMGIKFIGETEIKVKLPELTLMGQMFKLSTQLPEAHREVLFLAKRSNRV